MTVTSSSRKEYQTAYMRDYRSRSPAYLEKERKRDNDYKKLMRRTNPEWLARERDRRRKYGKVSRYRNKEKEKIVRVKYLEQNKHKVLARETVKRAAINGLLLRPEACELCYIVPEQLRDKRSKTGFRYPLRADHYKGYDRENWLEVQWVCKDCDGKQLRSKETLVK